MIRPMFVYGTLRAGERNFSRRTYLDVTKNVVAQGAIFFVSGQGGYPVAKFHEMEPKFYGPILGDLLYMDDESLEWSQIERMERGAGYDLVNITVRLEDGSETEAVAWHYIGKPRGRRIPSGDWVSETMIRDTEAMQERGVGR